MHKQKIEWQRFLPDIAGNAVEYYNIFLFAFLARTFTARFLPFQDETLGVSVYFLFIYFVPSLFGVFGAYSLGKVSDIKGRRGVLSLTIIGMGVCSFIVGCIPEYSSIGIIAPLMLFSLRALQVFFAAAEYNGGMICCIEDAPKKIHGTLSGAYCAATAAGIMIASSVSATIYYFNEDFWRVAFILSGIITAIVGYYRKKGRESDEFLKSKARPLPIKRNYSKVISIMISSCFFSVNYGLAIKVLPVIFSINSDGEISSFLISSKNSLILTIYMIFLFLAGLVCNRVSAVKVMIRSAFCSIMICLIAVFVLDLNSIYSSIFIELLLLMNSAFFIVAFNMWSVFLFETRQRHQNIAVGYKMGKILSNFMPAALIFVWGKTNDVMFLVAPLFMLSFFTIYIINYIKE